MRDQVMDVVRAHFRPEFLNRLDEIILFHRLQRERHGRDRRHPARRGCRSCWTTARSRSSSTTAARDWLADKGYDPAYGARPLKRVIQKSVQDPLAEMILAGTVKDGDTSRSRPASRV